MKKAIVVVSFLVLLGCSKSNTDQAVVVNSPVPSAPTSTATVAPAVTPVPTPTAQAINIQDVMPKLLSSFVEEHKLKRDDVHEELLSDIGKDTKKIYVLFTNAKEDGTPGVISFYDMATGKLIQSISNDAGYETQVLSINNPNYKRSIALKVSYHGTGVDIYALDGNKLSKIDSVAGEGLAIDDIDGDGYEEFLTAEMNVEKSESRANPINNYFMYKWDGSKYVKQKRLVDKFASGRWSTTDSDALTFTLNFVSTDKDKAGKITYYSEGEGIEYDFTVTSLSKDALEIKYTRESEGAKLTSNVKMTMIDDTHMSFIKDDRQYIVKKF